MGNTKRKYGELKEWPGGWVSQEIFDDKGNLIGYMDRADRHKGGSYNIYGLDGGLIAKDFRNAQSARASLMLIQQFVETVSLGRAFDILAHRIKDDPYHLVYLPGTTEPTTKPIPPFQIECK